MKAFFGYMIPVLIYAFLLFTSIPAPIDKKIIASCYALAIYMAFSFISFFGFFKFFEIILNVLVQDHRNNDNIKHTIFRNVKRVFLLIVLPVSLLIAVMNIPGPYDKLFSYSIYSLLFYSVQFYLLTLGVIKLLEVIRGNTGRP